MDDARFTETVADIQDGLQAIHHSVMTREDGDCRNEIVELIDIVGDLARLVGSLKSAPEENLPLRQG